MNEFGAWLLLLVIGVMLIIIGFTGSIGKIIGVMFTPGLLEERSSFDE